MERREYPSQPDSKEAKLEAIQKEIDKLIEQRERLKAGDAVQQEE